MSDENLQHKSKSQLGSVGSSPVFWGVLGGLLGLGALLLVLFQSLEVVIRPASPDRVDGAAAPPASVEPVTPVAAPSASPAELPAPEPTANPTPASPPVAADVDAGATAPGIQRGTLRVSNQTIHPIRVALLPQSSSATVGEGAIAPEAPEVPLPDAYREPVHWDFAPNEGEVSGLILSLPNGGLEVQSGDIIAAFAEDGSRRYWGPYVVGVTPLPVWNGEEWELPLRSPQPDSP